MNSELQTIERDDPTALKVFIAEYYFLKKDMEKAYELFAELFKDPALSPVMKVGFSLTEGRKVPKIPKGADVVYWNAFQAGAKKRDESCFVDRRGGDAAVILFSGAFNSVQVVVNTGSR